jgi:adenine phosphoribosyltransferase
MPKTNTRKAENGKMDLKTFIRDIPDFPKKGIIFKDITPLLRDPQALVEAIDKITAYGKERGAQVVAGIESRGFILGGAVAARLGVGFVPIRKKGKLPWKTVGESYQLEYGTDNVEMHQDAVAKGQKVLLVDDLLATGGTSEAAVRLIQKMGGKIAGIAFLVDLAFLKGRDRLKGHDVRALIHYE